MLSGLLSTTDMKGEDAYYCCCGSKFYPLISISKEGTQLELSWFGSSWNPILARVARTKVSAFSSPSSPRATRKADISGYLVVGSNRRYLPGIPPFQTGHYILKRREGKGCN